MKKLNLQDYFEKKKQDELAKFCYRKLCTTCMHPEFSCYCALVESFDPLVKFIILIHPIEFQRRIATGRMSHLLLKNSVLIRGQDYSEDKIVNQLLEYPEYEPFILYPSLSSTNLSELNFGQQKKIFNSKKIPLVFVIDGTWATARQMMRQSKNLQNIPRLCFTPQKPSNFRVRKQPEPHCLSTIEAIHQFMEIAGESFGFPKNERSHDRLLKVFDSMVDRQVNFVKKYA